MPNFDFFSWILAVKHLLGEIMSLLQKNPNFPVAHLEPQGAWKTDQDPYHIKYVKYRSF